MSQNILASSRGMEFLRTQPHFHLAVSVLRKSLLGKSQLSTHSRLVLLYHTITTFETSFLNQDHRGQFTNERYWGMYTFGQRNLVVTDVELGKLITIRDADYFVDRSA